MTIIGVVRTTWKTTSWTDHRRGWVDPFQAKFDERRLTQVAQMAEPPSRDVIELQQVALWHGVKSRISQASEAAAGGVERAPRLSRIRFRPEGISSTSIHHRELLHHLLVIVRRRVTSTEW